MSTTDSAAQATSWLKAEARPVRSYLTASILLGLLTGILILVQTVLLVSVVNAVIFHHATLASVMERVWMLLAAFSARATMQYASRRAGYTAASRVKTEVRQRLFRRLRTIGPIGLAQERGGELANTIIDGVEALEGYYARYLPQRAVASLLPFAILAVVYPLDWLSGIILTVTAIFIPVLMILIGEEARQRNQTQWNQLSRLSARFLDTIQGIGTLKMFGATAREARVVARMAEEHRDATMSVVRIAFVSSLMLELITTISIALVAITTGFRLLGGEMSFDHAYFILLIAPEFYLPLRTMGNHYHSRMGAAAAAERLVGLLDGEDRQHDTPHVTFACTQAPDGSHGISLQMENVRFNYHTSGDAPSARRPAALNGASLAVESGEHVALFGESGAGKSTILSLILKFADPDSGSIRANGRDLATFDATQWRNHISWMPQRPTLFFGDFFENIRLGRRDATDEEVVEAARRARAHDFIRRLPQGYRTRIGEQGQGLSGGELQRVALARLFLRNTPLILLDEPGAHLDPDTEELLHDAIRELATGRTMIAVAHRPSVARLADRVAVLKGGQVVETGAHADLVRTGGEYSRIMESFKVVL